jgi:hypothetical protein
LALTSTHVGITNHRAATAPSCSRLPHYSTTSTGNSATTDLTAGAREQPLVPAGKPMISPAHMRSAISSGQAAPFSPVITFLVRYQGIWWISADKGWASVPAALGAILDCHAALSRQDRAAADQAAIRAVIDLARDACR